MIINSPSDAALLQLAINKLRDWCELNELHLNLSKCEVLTLSHKKNPIMINYSFKDHIFERVDYHKDLGILIDSKLEFNKHIETITSKASSALGFVKRFCYDIDDLQTLKALFYTLVQSHLEYCSTVWMPYYNVHKDKIERVLRQFTMFARREYPNVSNGYKITPYKEQLSSLKMQSLDRRRINSSIMFIYDLIFGYIHCPYLRNELLFNISSRNLRRTDVLKMKNRLIQLSPSFPVNQMCKYFNIVGDLFLQPITRNKFKSTLLSLNDDLFNCSVKPSLLCKPVFAHVPLVKTKV